MVITKIASPRKQESVEHVSIVLYQMSDKYGDLQIKFDKVTTELKKRDRQKIVENYEGELLKVLDASSAEEITHEILTAQQSGQNFSGFKSVNELFQIVYNEDEQVNSSANINLESFEFYKFLVIKYQGKPVATGSIVIMQRSIGKKPKHVTE